MLPVASVTVCREPGAVTGSGEVGQRNSRGQLSQLVELRIGSGIGQGGDVALSDHSTSLAINGATDNGGTIARLTAIDYLINELDEVVRKANCDLSAHPTMVWPSDATA